MTIANNRVRSLVLGSLLGVAGNQAAADGAELELLRQELEVLKGRLEQLERQQASRPRVESLDLAVSGSERNQTGTVAAPEPPAPAVHVGGALRFNFVHRDHADSSHSKRGETGLDVFRLNIDGELNDFLISAE